MGSIATHPQLSKNGSETLQKMESFLSSALTSMCLPREIPIHPDGDFCLVDGDRGTTWLVIAGTDRHIKEQNPTYEELKEWYAASSLLYKSVLIHI